MNERSKPTVFTMPSYVIRDVLACLEEQDGARKLLTVTSWSGGPAKLDLRRWTAGGAPGEGLTLTIREARQLEAALRKYLEGHPTEAEKKEQREAAQERRKRELREKWIADIDEAFRKTAGRDYRVRPIKMAYALGVTSATVKNHVRETRDYYFSDGYVYSRSREEAARR